MFRSKFLAPIFTTLIFSQCNTNALTDFLTDSAKTTATSVQTFRLAVNVTGLISTGFKLAMNGEILTVSTNGTAYFTARFATGESYSVTILQYPQAKAQYCTLAGASGVFGSADASITAECTLGSAKGPLVGGTIISPLTLAGHADLTLGEWFAGDQGFSGNMDGAGLTARFSSPVGLTTDGTYIYLQETGGSQYTRRLDPVTREVTTLGISGGSDAIATDGEYLYSPNFTTCRVYKMSLTTNMSTLLAGGSCGFNDAVSGTSTQFNNPMAITYCSGYLYVTDYGNNSIRRIDPQSGATTTIAGTGAQGAANGPGAVATFYGPHAIFCYQSKLYVGEFGNYTIRQIGLLDAAYPVSVFSGSGAAGNTDGPATTAEFRRPGFFTTDGTYLYLTDITNYSIRKIDLATGYVTTISGDDTRQNSAIGTGSTGGTAGYERPKGLVSDGRYLYVADSTDHIIRRIE